MKIKDTILKTLIIVLISAIVGILLLIGSYLLPNSVIYNNGKASVSTFLKEGERPRVFEEIETTKIDNYTDALMIGVATYKGDDYSLIEKVLLNPKPSTYAPIEALDTYFNGNNTTSNTYARYWHGYLVYLRPLLMLGNYNNVRYFLALIHISLCVTYLILLYKKTGTYPVIVFTFAYIVSGLYIVPFSLQYFNVTVVTQISGIILLLLYEKLKEKDLLKYLFLITGIVTVYLDLLTFPIVSLGINLIICVLLDKKTNIKDLIIYTIMWFVGYGLMWVCKWILASIFTSQNVIAEALNQAIYRVNGEYDGNNVSYIDVLDVNIKKYSAKYALVPYIFIYVCNIAYKIKEKEFNINKGMLVNIIFIMLLPFIWYFVLKNHSYIHSFFTFRTLIPAFIGGLLLTNCFNKKVGNNE